MSLQQGPIIVVSDDRQPAFMAALGEGGLFPVIETTWAEASRAIAQLHPACVLVAASEGAGVELDRIARQIDGIQPYLPLIVTEPKEALPENAIPFSQTSGNWDRLLPRLRAALRVRTLHATVLRRRSDQPVKTAIAEIDPVRDEAVDHALQPLRARVPAELHVCARTCHGFDALQPDWSDFALQGQALRRVWLT